MKDRGKEFETKLIESFKSIHDADVRRLKDQQSFFKGSKNDCDLIVYHWPTLFVFEAKSFHGDMFLLSNISCEQFVGMFERSKKQGVIAGPIIWSIDYKLVWFINIKIIKLLLERGDKSISVEELRTQNLQKTSICLYESITKNVYPEFVNPVEFLRAIRWETLG